MTITTERRELSMRLRELINRLIPTSGRFTTLEDLSGIKASKWKNFYYRKQEASDEMLAFWRQKYPHDAPLLTTAKHYPPDTSEALFRTAAPTNLNTRTVGDRLVWVISEWAAPKGAALFQYLEQRAHGTINADAWASVIMRIQEPTLDMVRVVCEARPQFAEWIVNGTVTGLPAVDPTSAESVANWREALGPLRNPTEAFTAND